MQILKKILLSKYLLYFVFLLVILLSYLRVSSERVSKYEGNETVFELTILDIKKKDNYIVTFQGREKIIGYIKDFPYDVGDIVKIKGELIKPKNNTIPNLFNYHMYLQSRGINWELNVKEIMLIRNNRNILYSLKGAVKNRISKISHSEYIYAFLLGDTSYIDNDVKDKYQSIGLNYVLSIGSLQVMMLIRLLDKIKMSAKKKIIIKIISIIIYIIFTNKVIGILRSGLCYILKIILKKYKIKYKYSNIILLVGILLLIINPFYITQIGFLYSFSISLAISLLSKIIKGKYYSKLFMISLIAFLISLPITIYSNYEINFLAIVFSIIMVPIFHYIVFPLCIIVFIFPFLSFVLSFIVSLIEVIINFLSSINLLVFVFRKPSMFLIIIYYLVIILFFYKRKSFFLLIIILFIHNNVNKIIKEEFITFLDVNHGDAIVIKSNNELILIDNGGSKVNEYSDEISKYIKSLGISKIDKMFLTHGDMDHLGSSYKLIDKIKIKEVYFNSNELNNNEKELINKLINKRIKYKKISNYLYQVNNFNIKVKSYNLNTENDSSMMFYITNNKTKLLLMGDATTLSERYLISNYNLSKVNILKVGHHGSKTSTSVSFYNAIKPDISIISVGDKNIYHLPNYEVIDRIKSSKIYLTNTSGSITIKFLKNKIKVMECKP